MCVVSGLCSACIIAIQQSSNIFSLLPVPTCIRPVLGTGNEWFWSWGYILSEKNHQDFLLSHITLSIINSDHDLFCLVTNKSFKTGPLLTTSNWSKDWACLEHQAGKLMKSIKIYVLRSKLLIVLKFHKFKWLSILERRQNIWIWDQQRARAWAAKLLNM